MRVAFRRAASGLLPGLYPRCPHARVPQRHWAFPRAVTESVFRERSAPSARPAFCPHWPFPRGPPSATVCCGRGRGPFLLRQHPFLCGGRGGQWDEGVEPALSDSALPPLPPPGSDSESQEEVIQNIARQLAQIGDRMDRSIPQTLVDHLAMQFTNGSLSEEVSEKPLVPFLG